MANDDKEPLIEQIYDKVRDLVGLPPGRHSDGEPKPSTGADEPRGTLTADDAEGLPPHEGTGIKPIE